MREPLLYKDLKARDEEREKKKERAEGGDA